MTELIVPLTGEIVSVPSVDLTATDAHLIALLHGADEFKQAIRDYWQTPASDELLRRMDKRAHWTIRSLDYEAKSRSPKPETKWDPDALAQVLDELVAENVIDTDAARSALGEDVIYRPLAAGINAIRKLGDDIAERIDACGVKTLPRRRVKVVERHRI